MPYPTTFAKNPSPTDPMAKPASIKIRSIELAVAFFSGGTSVNAQAWIMGWIWHKRFRIMPLKSKPSTILVEKPKRIKPTAPEIAAWNNKDSVTKSIENLTRECTNYYHCNPLCDKKL